ncbi:uncharacterized protein SOCE26_011200 [Sorangium cellulosum]|uniref:Group II intron maturase-specific domain-containing protein n=1 Tax=Sorangium cellulosum TaxID=56 RepID=A0A2L0EK96_SORCE|nr:group II intron maturase-specific domain-containing protein [Sorangium cellulosum]AUX39725.1 uncharacterized protein SOCE26_011200 [Sorangium cellulosum]
MPETPSSATISPKLERIATLAKRAPGIALTSLAHHIDLDWLREAYRRTRKDGATGAVVLLFSRQDDARRVLEVLPRRFGKYGLTPHPDKTRLVPFRRPALDARPEGSKIPTPGTFGLLGLTHHWMRTRRGVWVIKQRTASNRFTRALARVAQWCRDNRHQPVGWQWRMLSQKLRGHFGYYGITGNFEAIGRFYNEVRRVWRKWLHRRSQRARMSWERMAALLER